MPCFCFSCRIFFFPSSPMQIVFSQLGSPFGHIFFFLIFLFFLSCSLVSFCWHKFFFWYFVFTTNKKLLIKGPSHSILWDLEYSAIQLKKISWDSHEKRYLSTTSFLHPTSDTLHPYLTLPSLHSHPPFHPIPSYAQLFLHLLSIGFQTCTPHSRFPHEGHHVVA